MKLKAILLSAMLLAPQTVFAQQVNVYSECRSYRIVEEYIPGYYNAYGNYVGGYVRRNRVRVPCVSDPYIAPVPYVAPVPVVVPYRYSPLYYDQCIDRRGIIGGTLGLLFGC